MSHEAIAAYEGSIAIRCHLAKIDPRNRQRQLDVSMSLKKLGDVKLDLDDGVGAVAAYERSISFWRRLLKSDPDNTLWQANLAESLEKIDGLKRMLAEERPGFEASETQKREICFSTPSTLLVRGGPPLPQQRWPSLRKASRPARCDDWCRLRLKVETG
jgi:hypothetical protein